jgi:uncharacterized protein YdhG (YjbR/CyaY superfamily)
MAPRNDDGGFSKEERAAMRERAKELKTNAKAEEAAAAVAEKIAELTGVDRKVAEALDRIVKEHAPELTPKTYYGMPGYAKDGKVLVFYQPGAKFDTRYGTVGFQDNAAIDDGSMFPVAFGFTDLSAADEKKLAALVKKAAKGA